MTQAKDKQILAVFDLDGTITRKDTFVPYLVNTLLRRPSRWTRIPNLVVLYAQHKLGYITNSELKAHFIRHILGALDSKTLSSWNDQFAQKVLNDFVLSDAASEIKNHRAGGATLILATASPDLYVNILGEALGFDQTICTRTTSAENGVFKGELDSANCYGEAKLHRLVAELKGSREDWHIIAYSDHISDLPLLTWADQGIVINPEKRLKAAAPKNGLALKLWR